ncbi:MAG: DUF559 domain-containing protein [Deltaproteobacteria bacterium]|nr:DUF559 domain-containing protein [Deltaproteobacteria bacterium]
MLPFNKKLKPFARNLRSNMTDAEQLIWSKIRRKQIGDLQFYRQKNIDHYRDRYLQMLGFAVLRFSDIDVLKNIDGVVERIHEHLKSPLTPL